MDRQPGRPASYGHGTALKNRRLSPILAAQEPGTVPGQWLVKRSVLRVPFGALCDRRVKDPCERGWQISSTWPTALPVRASALGTTCHHSDHRKHVLVLPSQETASPPLQDQIDSLIGAPLGSVDSICSMRILRIIVNAFSDELAQYLASQAQVLFRPAIPLRFDDRAPRVFDTYFLRCRERETIASIANRASYILFHGCPHPVEIAKVQFSVQPI